MAGVFWLVFSVMQAGTEYSRFNCSIKVFLDIQPFPDTLIKMYLILCTGDFLGYLVIVARKLK